MNERDRTAAATRRWSRRLVSAAVIAAGASSAGFAVAGSSSATGDPGRTTGQHDRVGTHQSWWSRLLPQQGRSSGQTSNGGLSAGSGGSGSSHATSSGS